MAEERVSILSWAEKYINLGWSVIPIKPKGKEPLIPWKEYQIRQSDLTQIKEWITKWPQMNLGVVTGKVSKLVVADFDGINGLKSMKSLCLTSNVQSLTGNGRQLYYKWIEHVDNSVSKIAPGVDIRGDGGFVVVPPSIHPNGKRYRWERFIPNSMQNFQNITSNTVVETVIDGHSEGWIAKALEEMKIGNIDETLTSILGRLRRDNYSSADAMALLVPVAREKGATEGHVEEKIRNIWERYPSASKIEAIWSRYESAQQTGPIGNQSLYSGSSELSIHSPADDDSFNKFTKSMQSDDRSGTKTGFPTLDKYFEGGIKSERPFTVAARTGTGKTNFAIALSYNLTQQNKKVLYFSTEFKYEKIWKWFMPYCKDPEEFRKQSFHVCDSFNPNIEQIEKALIDHKPDIFIFDYIQHITKDKDLLGKFIKDCQFLQKKYDIQAIIMAQLGRSADWVDDDGKRIEPRMDMISGSASIEEASSRVLLLSKTRDDPEKNEIIGVIPKNDQGDTGLIHFALMKHPFLFKELI